MRSPFIQTLFKQAVLKTYFTKTIFLIILLVAISQVKSIAQTKGLIYQKSAGNGYLVLDPNNDGYASTVKTGFTVTSNKETNSEIAYRFLPQFPGTTEPLNDLVTGSNGGHTDLANAPLGMYYDGTNMLFRIRLGGNSTASKGYSFLMDTDGVFNKLKLANGTLIEYVTPSKVTNLGFEYEVVLASNFDVLVYHHTGSGDTGDPVSSNVIWRASAQTGSNFLQYHQRVVAGTTEGGDADYFYDFYVPMTAFKADGGIGISATTPLRISGSTVTSAQTGLEGTISDIGGIDDRLYGNNKTEIWKNLVPTFPPTTPSGIQTGEFCSSAPTAPSVTSGLTTASTAIAGTFTTTATSGSYTIKIYKNSVLLTTLTPVTITSAGTKSWSYTITAGSLAAGDLITATATEISGSCTVTSDYSSVITVTTPQVGTCTTIAPYLFDFVNNQQTLTIYTNVQGTIKVYRDGALYAGTATLNTGFTATTINGVTYNFSYSFVPSACTSGNFRFSYNCGSNSDANNYGTITATLTPTSGCESQRSNPKYLNGNTTPADAPVATTQTATPNISQTFICSNTTTLSGTSVSGASIYLFINGFPAVTAADGSAVAITTAGTTSPFSWSIDLTKYSIPATYTTNGITAASTITVKAKTSTLGLSGPATINNNASITSISYNANCTTVAPVISGTYCPSATTITGTSTEADGTYIYLYKQLGASPNTTTDTRINGVTSVTSGAWAATLNTGVYLSAADKIYATAIAPNGKTISTTSTVNTISTPSLASTLSLVINTVKEGAVTVSGTINTSSLSSGSVTIYLYVDGIKFSETATVSTYGANTTWSISISSANQKNLYTGATLKAAYALSTGCESQQTTAVNTVVCNSPSTSPTVTPASQSVCYNSTASISVANSESGVVYQIYNGSTASGSSVLGTGGTITLTSDALTAGTTLTVKAYRAGANCSVVTLNSSSVISITSGGPTAFAVTPTTNTTCYNGTVTVTLASSEIGATYQIYNVTTGASVSSSISGTGSSITITSTSITTSGTFKVVATKNSCPLDMSNTFTITVPSNSLTVTPTTQNICVTGSASVSIANSESGVTYQIYNGGTAVGSAVAGNGSTITLTTTASTFTAGGYTLKIVASKAGCSNFDLATTFTVNVTSTALSSFAVSPTTATICSGNTQTLTLAGSQLGVTYQIYIGGVASGSAVTGTGSAISLISGTLTTTSTLTVQATNTCSTTQNMSNTSTVTVNSLPTLYYLTPTSVSACYNTITSNAITLSGSETGVTYQLYNVTTSANSGSAVSGTGSSLTFSIPALTASATFKVIATRTTGGCTLDMTNTVFVSVPSPALTVTPSSQTVCTGNTASVTIYSTLSGWTYQIFNGATAIGSPVVSTGGDITLTTSSIASAGTVTYKVTASKTGCSSFDLTNTFTITAVSSLTAYTVTPTTQSICSGATVTLSLSGSQVGVTYYIYDGTSSSGSTVAGTGSAITLTSAALTATTTLTVRATNSCGTVSMSGSSVVTVNNPPTAFTVTPTSSSICTGSTVTLTLSGSQSGVTYQIYNGNSTSGSSVAGSGSSITLISAALSTSTTLYIVATGSASCSSTTMSGTTAVTVNAIPAAPAITINNTSVCSGSSATISVTSPTNGLVYKLYIGGVFSSSVTAASGSATFSVSTAGTYTVTVTSSASCESTVSNSVALTVNALPSTPAITINNSSVCSGSSATISVTSPTNGLVYKLYAGGTYTGTSVTAATGAATFTVSTSGTYTVTVTSSAGCESAQSSSVTLTVNALPSAPAISINNNSVCSGTSATISVTGPTNGLVYKLYLGGTYTGTSVTAASSTATFSVNTAGTYTVTVTSAVSCESSASNSVALTVNAIPTTPAITINNNSICAGSSATISVTSPTNGLVYKLYAGGAYTGTSVTAASGSATFTVSTAGTYTVTVTSSASCESAQSSSVTLSVNALPSAPAITINNSSVCSGTSATISVTSPTNGLVYKLYIGGVFSSSVTAGSGAATFSVSTSGTYTVTVTSAASCESASSNSVTLTVNAIPTTPVITLDQASVCGSGTGTITVSSPVSGYSYQLYKDGISNGSAIAYSSGSLTFSVTSTGAYTIKGTSAANCTSAFSNSVSFTVNASAVTPTITSGASTVCAGNTTTITVSNPQNGYSYQLLRGGVAEGSPVTYSSGTLSFTTTAISSNATFTVQATTTNGCIATSSGTTVTATQAPTAFTITPSTSSICSGSTTTLTLSSSEIGVTYVIYNGVSTTGSSVAGTGSSITLTSGALTSSTTLTVKGSNNTCGSLTTMSGSTVVTVTAIPSAPSISINNTAVCSGSSATISVNSATNGLLYKLYKGGVYTGTSVTAASGSATFSVSTTGSYTVTAASGSCVSAASGSVSLTVNNSPTVFTLTPTSQTICNNATAQVSLSGSEIGVSYQIYKSESGGAYVITGSAVSGTGGTLTLTTGNLTVDATLKVVATIAGCTSVDMSGSSVANVEAAPATQTVTSPTTQSICNGSKASITLSSSETGVTYQLFNTTTGLTTGAAIAGNGSQITLMSAAITTNATYSLKVIGTLTGCGSTADMTGTTSVTVADCNILYAVQPPYLKTSYIHEEIIATPSLQDWTYVGPLTYTIVSGTPLTGTAIAPNTGQIYVSTTDMSTLQSGTKNLRIRATDSQGNFREAPMTYTINDADNAEGNTRLSTPDTLPVTLIYFNGKVANGAVVLNWATMIEKNNEYFDIERSTNAKTFTKIGQLKGGGNSRALLKYTYSDKNAPVGTTYYRLKQVDLDGHFEYSPVIVVSDKGIASKLVTESLITYPNPTTGKLTLILETPDNYIIEIRNILGKVVYTATVSVDAQKSEIETDLTNLANGTYLIKVTSKDKQFVTRVVKN